MPAPVVSIDAWIVSPLAKTSVAALTFLSAPTALPRLTLDSVTPAGGGGGGGGAGTGAGAGGGGGGGGGSFLPQAARTMLAAATRAR